MKAPLSEVTQLLEELRLGRTEAVSRLFPLVYQELRDLAEQDMLI